MIITCPRMLSERLPEITAPTVTNARVPTALFHCQLSYPFTADKLKAKSSIGVFLSMDLSIFGQNLEYCWNQGSLLKD
ncbi:hypothetical protein G5714_014832 [Onychostoma macrolepis]|uniref:Uncharacterized protein n=1 Tax=Onychostoma macrolepis TaxID=369639 RepID=A0A7J6CB62_9TELE|nr:hypothetical protein G5714_014832 [Onychostoma macrolepis]